MKIETTSDYKIFKLHNKNRKLNHGKIKRLSEAMKRNNLLPIFPVIINDKNEILDGQHRVEAAKLAKVPISFVTSNGEYNISLVAETNSFQNGWNLMDYIRYYTKSKRKSYIELVEVAEKFKVPATMVANISFSQKTSDDLKRGRFIFSHKKEIVDLLEYCLEFHTNHGFDSWKQRGFVRAINHILGIPTFSKMRLDQKITTHRNLFVKKSTKEEYLELLEKIYNTNTNDFLRFT